MDAREVEELVDALLLKRARNEKLTEQEERILAYGYHAAGCSVCGGRKNSRAPVIREPG